MNSLVTPNVTSSQELVSGPLPFAGLDGLMTDPSGPEVVLANLSAEQAKARGLLTSGTSGLPSIGSSTSAALQSSLESKLRLRTASVGSTLYRLTWKDRITPSGRRICALRASPYRSVNPKRDSGYGGPYTIIPTKSGCTILPLGLLQTLAKERRISANVFILSGWPTPQVADHNMSRVPKPYEYSTKRLETRNPGQNLADTAQALAGWPTATTRDHKGGYQGGRVRNGQLSTDTLDVAAQLSMQVRVTANGQLLTGSAAKTASGGPLNPALSRWLMGLSDAWANCAPTGTRSKRTVPPAL